MRSHTKKQQTIPNPSLNPPSITAAPQHTCTADPPLAPSSLKKSKPNPHACGTPANPKPKRRKTMSPAQLAANRANAMKSTGPRTREGKARSARNALKHGLVARHLVLSDGDPDEVPQEFRILLHGLLDDFCPRTQAEKSIVHTIATCHWRLRRALRFETQCVMKARNQAADAARAAGRPFNRSAIVLPQAPDLDRLLNYEAAIQRDLARALRQLQRIRRADRESAAIGYQPKQSAVRRAAKSRCGE